jgi:hypothetical protein
VSTWSSWSTRSPTPCTSTTATTYRPRPSSPWQQLALPAAPEFKRQAEAGDGGGGPELRCQAGEVGCYWVGKKTLNSIQRDYIQTFIWYSPCP